MNGSPEKNFWGVCGVDDSMLLTVKSLHSCSACCVDGVKSQPFTVGVVLLQRCVFVTTLLHNLNEFDKTSQPSRRKCLCWKLHDQPFAFGGRFRTACILWTGLDYASPRSVKSKRQYTAAGREVQNFLVVFTSDRMRNKELDTWSRLGVEPAKLSKVTDKHVAFLDLLWHGCCHRNLPMERKRMWNVSEWKKTWWSVQARKIFYLKFFGITRFTWAAIEVEITDEIMLNTLWITRDFQPKIFARQSSTCALFTKCIA